MRNGLALGLMFCAVAGTAVGVGSLAASSQDNLTKNTALTLDHGWQFRQVAPETQDKESGWLPATVPGDVHLDLLANQKIPDPFFRENEAKLQWIEDESWEYRLNFDASAALPARTSVDHVFDGLDAAAQVHVNGVQVLNADNMFRIWRVPVKSHLHQGKNALRVVFPSPIKAAEAVAASDGFRLKSKTQDKTYIRKAAYEYGWDWGPKFVTSGIWRPVRLESWDKARIADFAIRQRDVSKEVAHLSAEVEIEAASAGPAMVSAHYIDKGKPAIVSETLSLHAGRNVIALPVEIRQPKLWYPVGYGDQPLYEFTAQVSTGAQAADARKTKAGLRSTLLHRELDKWGRSFELVVNGIPIFAKGADVIPFDSFPNRVKTTDYRRILESARDANMNMIRHWGGGYYETDEFYSICEGAYKIRGTSPVLARSVYLSFGNLNVKVSDNYFNLLLEETVEITATGPDSLDQLKAQLKVRTLQDAFSSGGQR